MLDFYHHQGPNPLKVALFLEEATIPYRLIPVSVYAGEQHTPEFRAINPNGKVPAIRDGEITVFDSNAILLYLADKHGKFISTDPVERNATLSWLMFAATGIGPYSGQAIHFNYYAPDTIPYAINRYEKEAARHYQVLEGQLSKSPYIVGDSYSIADMAAWGWAKYYTSIDKNGFKAFPKVDRWYQSIAERPATQRAFALKDEKAKMELDDDARRVLFPQNY